MFGDEDDLPEDQTHESDEEGNDEEDAASAPEGEDEGRGEQVEDAAEEGEDGLLAAQPPARPAGRAQRAVLAAKQEARAARERAEAVERELASLRAERQQTTQRETERERQERLALMTSEERMEFHLQELRQQQEQFQRQTQAQQQDAQDRAAYLAKAATEPKYRKYAEEVEKEYQIARSHNVNITREAVLKFMLGHKILTGDKSVLATAKKAGAAKVSQQRTNPPGASSDQGGRKRGEKSLRERLEGVTF